MRVSSRACVLVAAASLGVFAPLGCLGGTPQFTLRSQRLAGKELRVILETSTTYRRFDSSSRKTASAKGWLITVDLSKEGPIAERSRVVGPLWDVANERSSLSFDAGAHFTKEDVAAARATPFIDLEPDGTVVRIAPDRDGARRGMIREHLVLDANPSWKVDGPFLPLPPLGPPMNEETVLTLSRRYQLQYAGGKSTLHELFTGNQIQDPWLEAAFTAYRQQTELQNVKTWLTDDLKYLVSSPRTIWNDEHQVIHETFEVKGKKYSRGEYGLVWQRPNPDPIVFKKDRKEEIGAIDTIVQALSIEGRLYFYYRGAEIAGLDGAAQKQESISRLVPFDGGPGYQIKAPTKRRVEWDWLFPYRMQLREHPSRIVFFGTNDFMTQAARNRVPDEAVVVFIWDLKCAALTSYDAPTGELFNVRSGEYVPKKSTTVR